MRERNRPKDKKTLKHENTSINKLTNVGVICHKRFQLNLTFLFHSYRINNYNMKPINDIKDILYK